MDMKIDIQINRLNRESGTKSLPPLYIDFNKGAKTMQQGKHILLNKVTWTAGYSHAKECGWTPTLC